MLGGRTPASVTNVSERAQIVCSLSTLARVARSPEVSPDWRRASESAFRGRVSMGGCARWAAPASSPQHKRHSSHPPALGVLENQGDTPSFGGQALNPGRGGLPPLHSPEALSSHILERYKGGAWKSREDRENLEPCLHQGSPKVRDLALAESAAVY
jgi:hypothetical protein